MAFSFLSHRPIAGAAVSGILLVLAGCQSGGPLGALNVGGGGTEQQTEVVDLAELRAYCPSVLLREGTAFFNTYERNAQDDPSRVVYQASITDVTRSCSYDQPGMLRINVAVAGRVVPGPKGSMGAITMPIRIAVLQGGELVYSQLHNHQVQVADTAGATQFIFNDPNISIPVPSRRSVQVFAGYDEGPATRR